MATDYIVANIHRLISLPTKDGAANTWTSAKVVLTSPAGVTTEYSATYAADAGDGSPGWYYDWTVPDSPGDWTVRWKGVDSGTPAGGNQTDDISTITVASRRS